MVEEFTVGRFTVEWFTVDRFTVARFTVDRFTVVRFTVNRFTLEVVGNHGSSSRYSLQRCLDLWNSRKKYCVPKSIIFR